MPMMKMNRNFTVRTTAGHAIRFERGVEKMVPDNGVVVEECMRFGAEFCKETDAIEMQDEITEKKERVIAPSQRRKKAIELMEEMCKHSGEFRDAFTAANRPKVEFVKEKLGFDVSGEEIKDWWNAVVHPDKEE